MPSEKSVTIQDQLDLERRMIDIGVTKFSSDIIKAEEKGRGYDTGYARRLMSNLIEPLSEEINKFINRKGPGNDRVARKLMQPVQTKQLAYFILRGIFKYFTQEESIQCMCNEVGRYIEDEQKFKCFSDLHGDYYNQIIKDFKRKGTKNYRHVHRVLTKKANEKNIHWIDWTDKQRMSVGLALLKVVLNSTDLVQKKTFRVGSKKRRKVKVVLMPTPIAIEWVKEYNKKASLLSPNTLPCIIEPDDWVDYNQGGFYSPQLRSIFKLVKSRIKKHISYFTKKNLKPMMEAINILQKTPWKVNEQVLDVLRIVWDKNLGIGMPPSNPYVIPEAPFPKTLKPKNMSKEQLKTFTSWKHEAAGLYTLETQRVSKCFQVLRVLQIANEFKQYTRFWFVYFCDFRGRIYSATTSFSPQGPDFAKGVLLFARGKPLGKTGERWLKIHGANCYGYDKVSYDARVHWVEEHTQDILNIAKDPISNRDLWANANTPYQYLAFCFEYQKYKKHGNKYISHLPISMDGSCNGLQNFSAMVKDSIGGKATNLVPGDTPSDIYNEVAKLCTKKLRKEVDPKAKKWVQFIDTFYDGGFPRNLTKKSVMTLPYGSTQHSCTDNILTYLLENHKDYFNSTERFKLAIYLTPILWGSINDVVIAARSVMKWLQNSAGVLSKEGFPCIWITPLGFPVYQGTLKTKLQQIATQLFGKVRYTIQVATSLDTLSILKQKQGIAPNFVHSMDACHLMGTIIKLQKHKIKDIVCVHDEYGTHACNIDVMQKTLREVFAKMYTEHDVLHDFKRLNTSIASKELPAIPEIGTLDLNDIKQSLYFFC